MRAVSTETESEIRGGTEMPWNGEWSGLADFLANMIEKYAGEMDLDTLPDPDNYYKMKRIKEMYLKYMRLSAQARRAA